MGVYVHMCTCAHSTDRPLKKKSSDVVDNTSSCIHTCCCSGSQVPSHSSLISTIRACFLNHKEEKKMADFALPSSPSLIFTTQSCNFSRLMRPFVSHKFHHKRSMLTTRLFQVYAWSVRACTLYGSKKPCIYTASYICLQQIQLQCHHL